MKKIAFVLLLLTTACTGPTVHIPSERPVSRAEFDSLALLTLQLQDRLRAQEREQAYLIRDMNYVFPVAIQADSFLFVEEGRRGRWKRVRRSVEYFAGLR
jgi:hypothetical protein